MKTQAYHSGLSAHHCWRGAAPYLCLRRGSNDIPRRQFFTDSWQDASVASEWQVEYTQSIWDNVGFRADLQSLCLRKGRLNSFGGSRVEDFAQCDLTGQFVPKPMRHYDESLKATQDHSAQ